MLPPKTEDALNQQLNAEFYSAYLYLSMSAYFHSVDLMGFENWMRIQAQEELLHAAKFYQFICDRDGRVKLEALAGPKIEWKSTLEVLQDAYAHEQLITKKIGDLVDLSAKEKDHATHAFMQFFVTEQVEEEATLHQIIKDVKRINDHPNGVFLLDRELAQRTFTMPAPGAAGA